MTTAWLPGELDRAATAAARPAPLRGRKRLASEQEAEQRGNDEPHLRDGTITLTSPACRPLARRMKAVTSSTAATGAWVSAARDGRYAAVETGGKTRREVTATAP